MSVQILEISQWDIFPPFPRSVMVENSTPFSKAAASTKLLEAQPKTLLWVVSNQIYSLFARHLSNKSRQVNQEKLEGQKQVVVVIYHVCPPTKNKKTDWDNASSSVGAKLNWPILCSKPSVSSLICSWSKQLKREYLIPQLYNHNHVRMLAFSVEDRWLRAAKTQLLPDFCWYSLFKTLTRCESTEFQNSIICIGALPAWAIPVAKLDAMNERY